MRTLLTFLCCLFTLSAFADEHYREDMILSTPEQLAALTCEPSFLIGNLISPMGGHPALRETDLVVKGAQNIALTRIYIPPYIPCSFPQHKRCPEEYEKNIYIFIYLITIKGGSFFLT